MRQIFFRGIGYFAFLTMAGLPAIAPASSAASASKSHHSLAGEFHKMDSNHDGLLTMREFVAHHKKKMGTSQAAARYKQLAAKGGTTRRNGAVGMTFEQFKAAHGKRA